MFIAFEGPDGAGKSTQVRLLTDHLRRRGCEVEVLREPGGTALGQALRRVLLKPETGELSPATEVFLFMAARRHLVETRIRPALAAGRVVVCDRFLWSSVVYQGIVGGLGAGAVLRLGRLATGGLRPARTFLLDLPVASAAARQSARRGADRFEGRGRAFQERVRRGYLALARRYPRQVAVIAADADPAAVHRAVLAKLPKGLADG
jgi:dTMP kinase